MIITLHYINVISTHLHNFQYARISAAAFAYIHNPKIFPVEPSLAQGVPGDEKMDNTRFLKPLVLIMWELHQPMTFVAVLLINDFLIKHSDVISINSIKRSQRWF